MNKNSLKGYYSQIFYPRNIFPCSKAMYLIGWNLDNFRCVIGFGVPVDHAGLDIVDIGLLFASKELEHIVCHCGSEPIILGEWLPSISHSYLPSTPFQNKSIWITLTNSKISSVPSLYSIYSLGYRYQTSGYMISFDSIDSDNFNCLRHKRGINDKPSDLTKITNQINCSGEIERALNHYIENLANAENKEILRNSKLIVLGDGILTIKIPPFDSSSSLQSSINCSLKEMIMNSIYRMSYYSVSTMKVLIALLENKTLFHLSGKSIMSWIGTEDSEKSMNDISLCDVSIFAVHLRDRLRRLDHLIDSSLDFSHSWLTKTPFERFMLFRRISDMLFYYFFDTAIGIVVGAAIWLQRNVIVQTLHHWCGHFQKIYVLDIMNSFNNYPLGVKLNPIITEKISQPVIWLIGVISNAHQSVSVLRIPFLVFTALMGIFGFSTQVMIAIDFFRLLTLPIATMHRLFSIQHQFQLQVMTSLLRLFMGKKKNILRQRIDHCEYDLFQLMFGIVLFIIVVFLFPSFAVFFYLFAFLQLVFVIVQVCLWALVVFIKDFSYFVMVWSVIFGTRSGSEDVMISVDLDTTSIATCNDSSSNTTSRAFVNDSNVSQHDGSVPSPILSSTLNEKSIKPKKRISFREELDIFEPHSDYLDGSHSETSRTGTEQSKEAIVRSRSSSISQKSPKSNLLSRLLFANPFNHEDVGDNSEEEIEELEDENTSLLSHDSAVDQDDRKTMSAKLEKTSNLRSTSDNNSSDFFDHRRQVDDHNAAMEVECELDNNVDMILENVDDTIDGDDGIEGNEEAEEDDSNDTTDGTFDDSDERKPKSSLPSKAVKLDSSKRPTFVRFLMEPKEGSFWDNFCENYLVYIHYFVNEKDILWNFLRGVALGKPALDIQLIRATNDISLYDSSILLSSSISSTSSSALQPSSSTSLAATATITTASVATTTNATTIIGAASATTGTASVTVASTVPSSSASILSSSSLGSSSMIASNTSETHGLNGERLSISSSLPSTSFSSSLSSLTSFSSSSTSQFRFRSLWDWKSWSQGCLWPNWNSSRESKLFLEKIHLLKRSTLFSSHSQHHQK